MKSSDLRREFKWLLSTLQEQGKDAPRVIVYCQRLADCSELYGLFEDAMQDRTMGTEPCNRLYAMYHSETDDTIKEHVHESFGQEDGTIRILFATGKFIIF